MAVSYGIIIPARNEEEHIRLTLLSLKNQTLKPSIVVVIDDSSSDKTAEIARKNSAYVIEVKRKSNASATGTPYLAFVLNKGLEVLEKLNKIDYVMISGAECLYPKDYVERVINKMKEENVVIASGTAYGEPVASLSVRGAGRIIDARWFKKIGFRYPLNYGFETWLIFKALSQGYKVRVYRDVRFLLLRRTTMNIRKAYLYGKGMKALGYTTFYAIGRAFLFLAKGYFNEAKYLVLGYFAGNVEKYSDVAEYTKYIQIKNLINRFLRGLTTK